MYIGEVLDLYKKGKDRHGSVPSSSNTAELSYLSLRVYRALDSDIESDHISAYLRRLLRIFTLNCFTSAPFTFGRRIVVSTDHSGVQVELAGGSKHRQESHANWFRGIKRFVLTYVGNTVLVCSPIHSWRSTICCRLMA